MAQDKENIDENSEEYLSFLDAYNRASNPLPQVKSDDEASLEQPRPGRSTGKPSKAPRQKWPELGR